MRVWGIARWATLATASAMIVGSIGPVPALAETSDPGRITFTSTMDGNYEVYVMDADGSNTQRLTQEPADDRAPRFSFDGRRIVFNSSREGDTQVFAMNADGSQPANLTNRPYPTSNSGGAFSPDGTAIVFSTYNYSDRTWELYTMNADGSSQQPLVSSDTSRPIPGFSPVFSPDGSKVAFTSYADGDADVYLVNSVGGAPVNLTSDSPANDFGAAISPDGSKIAFSSDRDGNAEIYVMDFDGSNPTRLTYEDAGDLEPSFSPDGAKIAFRSDRVRVDEWDANSDIFVMDADGRNVTNITQNPSEDRDPQWGPWAKLDFSPPEIVITSPEEAATYYLQQRVAASYECTDAIDPDPECSGTVPPGGDLDTSTVGPHQFIVTARDEAGNEATAHRTYSVEYRFSGFAAPVTSALNSAKAGQTIPLRFRVTDDLGIGVTDLSDVSLRVVPLACGPEAATDPIGQDTDGSKGLQNLGAGNYLFGWKTSKSFVGSCRTVILALGAGGSHSADFSFLG